MLAQSGHSTSTTPLSRKRVFGRFGRLPLVSYSMAIVHMIISLEASFTKAKSDRRVHDSRVLLLWTMKNRPNSTLFPSIVASIGTGRRCFAESSPKCLRNIGCLLNLQGNAQRWGKRTFILAEKYHRWSMVVLLTLRHYCRTFKPSDKNAEEEAKKLHVLPFHNVALWKS